MWNRVFWEVAGCLQRQGIKNFFYTMAEMMQKQRLCTFLDLELWIRGR
jgi:hypothetical protein